MSDAYELLEVAKDLGQSSSARTKQAHLSRAVSTAYYALFSYLIDKAVPAILPSSQPNTALSERLRRHFEHRTMLQVCKIFSDESRLDGVLAADLPVLPLGLRTAARMFIMLHGSRELADYGSVRVWTHNEVMTLVSQTESAMAALNDCLDEPATQIFLRCLLLGNQLTADRKKQ